MHSETRYRIIALTILVLIVLVGVLLMGIQANSVQIAADTMVTLEAAKTAARLEATLISAP